MVWPLAPNSVGGGHTSICNNAVPLQSVVGLRLTYYCSAWYVQTEVMVDCRRFKWRDVWLRHCRNTILAPTYLHNHEPKANCPWLRKKIKFQKNHSNRAHLTYSKNQAELLHIKQTFSQHSGFYPHLKQFNLRLSIYPHSLKQETSFAVRYTSSNIVCNWFQSRKQHRPVIKLRLAYGR